MFYFNNSCGNITTTPVFVIKNSFGINNLMEIDEIAGTVTLDFYWRLVWDDKRIVIPDLADYFATYNPYMLSDGVEISPYVRSSNNALNVYLPIAHFVDGVDINVLEETILYKPTGRMFWSRHVVATIQQPSFSKYSYYTRLYIEICDYICVYIIDYSKYPMDTQTIVIRVEPFGLNGHFALMNFTTAADGRAAVSFIYDPQMQANFAKNPIWSYDSYSYSTVDQYYATGTNSMYYSQAVVYLNVTRLGNGIIYRLGLPIMLLLCLGIVCVCLIFVYIHIIYICYLYSRTDFLV